MIFLRKFETVYFHISENKIGKGEQTAVDKECNNHT